MLVACPVTSWRLPFTPLRESSAASPLLPQAELSLSPKPPPHICAVGLLISRAWGAYFGAAGAAAAGGLLTAAGPETFWPCALCIPPLYTFEDPSPILPYGAGMYLPVPPLNPQD